MNDKPLSILMVANYYPHRGGISGLVENLSEGLVHEGFRVSIHSVGGFLPGRLSRYAELFFIAKEFDLIHCHGCANLGFLPVLAGTVSALLYQKPAVMTYHDCLITEPFIRNSPMVRMVVPRLSVITTPFEETSEAFRSYGEKVVAVPNILDADKWEFKQRARFRPNIVWTRNTYCPELAIEAFLILREAYPESTLTMCGKAATGAKLKQYKDVPGLRLLGFVSREELPKILMEADIYLNTFSHDSFGYAVFEAMAMGLAVVSVPSPALASLAGSNSITFSEQAIPESLANALKRVLSDQDLARRKTESGRDVVEKLTWEAIFPVWKGIYQAAWSTCKPG
jgi:glycosyltransferase involved in cell wall biosynthesis